MDDNQITIFEHLGTLGSESAPLRSCALRAYTACRTDGRRDYCCHDCTQPDCKIRCKDRVANCGFCLPIPPRQDDGTDNPLCGFEKSGGSRVRPTACEVSRKRPSQGGSKRETPRGVPNTGHGRRGEA